MVVLVGMGSCGKTHFDILFSRFWVPLQSVMVCQCRGWKSKMLCQVRNKFLCGTVWGSRSLICPSTFRFYDIRNSAFFLFYVLGCFCCWWSVWTRSVKEEEEEGGREGCYATRFHVWGCGWGWGWSAIRGFTKDSLLGALQSDIQCQSQKICDKWVTEYVLQGHFIKVLWLKKVCQQIWNGDRLVSALFILLI